MARLDIAEEHTQKPLIQIAPLIDVVFLTLIFFMTLSVFNQLETELSVTVPRAKESKESLRSPGEIVINVLKDGTIVVNERTLTYRALEAMLQQVSSLFPDQPVIIRADELAYHKHVINVLDACAATDIWNISFATIKEE